MPRGDGTGPAGMGPMSGRAAGFCAGYNALGFMNAGGQRGFRGRGRGRGFCWPACDGPANPYAYGGAPFAPQVTARQELESLKQQAEYLKESLNGINKRVEQLQSEVEK